MPRSSLAPTIYTTPQVADRPISETPLQAWMLAAGVSQYAVAKACDLSPQGVKNLRQGQSIPSLVTAFKIEKFSRGAVPAVSWLGTELGRQLWKGVRHERPSE